MKTRLDMAGLVGVMFARRWTSQSPQLARSMRSMLEIESTLCKQYRSINPVNTIFAIRTRRFHVGRPPLQWTPTIGSEPGIGTDIHDTKSHPSELGTSYESEIKVIDYSDKQIVEQDVPSVSLGAFLQSTPKPAWANCRWIYVNGLNWDVVRCVGENKKLHRLAIEDVLDTTTPAKVDWYDGHCFMELPLQKLVYLEPQNDHGHRGRQRTPVSDEKAKIDEPDDDLPHRTLDRRHLLKWHTFSHSKFGMSVEQVSIFLTSDNTVITFFEHSGPDILRPILTRLHASETVVRSSNEPSMLVQAVVDAIVDLSLPIGKAVGDAFSELEFAVLSNPTIRQSKQIYILRSGLTHLMDNTMAIGGLVRTLCDHRALAVDSNTSAANMQAFRNQPVPASSVHISPLAQVYLQDVQDHVRTMTGSLNMSIRSAENLTSLIFNTIAASQNESVRQLTLISCFFLPLTFLSGYFGMNFDPMPVVNDHSDAFFWVLATPIMIFTLTALFIRSNWFRSFRLRRTWRRSPPRGESLRKERR